MKAGQSGHVFRHAAPVNAEFATWRLTDYPELSHFHWGTAKEALRQGWWLGSLLIWFLYL